MIFCSFSTTQKLLHVVFNCEFHYKYIFIFNCKLKLDQKTFYTIILEALVWAGICLASC